MLKKLSLLFITILIFASCGKSAKFLTPEEAYDLNYKVWILNDSAAKEEYEKIINDLGELTTPEAKKELEYHDYLKEKFGGKNDYSNRITIKYVSSFEEITKEDVANYTFRINEKTTQDGERIFYDIRSKKLFTGTVFKRVDTEDEYEFVYRVKDGKIIETLLAATPHYREYTYYVDNKPYYVRRYVSTGFFSTDSMLEQEYAIELFDDGSFKKAFRINEEEPEGMYITYNEYGRIKKVERVSKKKKNPPKKKRGGTNY